MADIPPTIPNLRGFAVPLIQGHEGLMLVAYDDATGKPIGPGTTIVGHPTIGFGRTLDIVGINEVEAETLFWEDYERAVRAVSRDLRAPIERILHRYGVVRTAVLIDMAYNLGSISSFRKMLAALRHGHFDAAAAEILNSKWAQQCPQRAADAARLMKEG